MEINDVVQFNENHEWCGCLGIIYEIKNCRENAIEKIGEAILVEKEED